MKKIVIIVLLLLLIYNSVGYYVLFHIQQLKIQQEFNDYVKNSFIADEDLVLFKLPIEQYEKKIVKDFNRIQGDFETGGKFYEIIRQQLENDTLFIYCLNNEKQDKLYQQLEDHIQNHLLDTKSSKQSKSNKSFSDLFKDYLPQNSNCFDLKRNNDFLISRLNVFRIETFSNFTLSIPTPPPRSV